MEHRPALWVADWSDSEDEDFRAAWKEAGVEARVIRSTPLGRTAGTSLHRLRSWPAYVSLAFRALRHANGAPVVAWQPLAGALAGLAPRGDTQRLVVLNPLLSEGRPSVRRRLVLSGLRRADRIVFFTRAGVQTAARLGIDPERTTFVPLGVRARRREAAPTGEYLLAAGREARDWETLARAADGFEREIRVLGPAHVPPPLRALAQVDREQFLDLLTDARALVVPLRRTDRPAGQLAVLDAMSVGRPVVATRNQGTEDYVTDDTGLLVDPGDADGMRAALERVSDAAVAERMSAAALAAAQGPFSLTGFVRRVDELAREL